MNKIGMVGKEEVKQESVYYTAGGVVLGNLWMGGAGYYPACSYSAEDNAKLIVSKEGMEEVGKNGNGKREERRN